MKRYWYTHQKNETDAYFPNSELLQLLKHQDFPKSTYQVYRLYGAGQSTFFVKKIRNIEAVRKQKVSSESAERVVLKI